MLKKIFGHLRKPSRKPTANTTQAPSDEVTHRQDRCTICSWPEFSDSHIRFLSISTYRKSREAGCLGCGIVLNAVDAFDAGWIKTHASDGGIALSVINSVLKVYLRVESPEEPAEFAILQGQGEFSIIYYSFFAGIPYACIILDFHCIDPKPNRRSMCSTSREAISLLS